MPAPTNVVWVQDVQANDPTARLGNAAVGLRTEEVLRGFRCELLLLGKGHPFLHDGVPNGRHSGQIALSVAPHNDFHGV